MLNYSSIRKKMLKSFNNLPPGRAIQPGLVIIRIAIAIILGVHSVSRIVKGDVAGFGTHLNSIGLPLGVPFAWFITLSTLCASVAMISGRLVVPSCVIHIIVLLTGIFLVHAPHGWFVVGGEGKWHGATASRLSFVYLV